MPDALDEAAALLMKRRSELLLEVDRINKALSVLAPNGVSVAVERRDEGSTAGTTIRSKVIAILDEEGRFWTPAEMAATLAHRGLVPSAEEALKGVRTTFWALRQEGLAIGVGVGRGMKTISARFSDQASDEVLRQEEAG